MEQTPGQRADSVQKKEKKKKELYLRFAGIKVVLESLDSKSSKALCALGILWRYAN
jgi:hypothetical protein